MACRLRIHYSAPSYQSGALLFLIRSFGWISVFNLRRNLQFVSYSLAGIVQLDHLITVRW